MINIIAVIGKNNELGYGNNLLWDIPEDMKRFKDLTTGHIVIMGRKTFESIGKALPNRENIIITRDKNYIAPGCEIVHSLKDALEVKTNGKEIFIIGGGKIYKQSLPFTEKLYLTIVDDDPYADTFFPNYSEFSNIFNKKTLKNNKLKFTFLELTK